MIKCPLCGWNNAESTQHCVSCGGDLERRTGLIQEEGNPDYYSFTPPRRILNKGVGAMGSGNDLVFKFSKSKLAILLILLKAILFVAFPYAGIELYRDGNSLFYILVPITILYLIDVVGWIMFSRGGRKRKRKLMSLGMRFLYAFHAISMAYCILTVLITFYISIVLGLSWNLGKTLNSFMGSVSSKETVFFMVAATVVLLILIVFLNICAKFFYHLHDMFSKNSLRYYRFTGVIAVVFIISTVLGFACTALTLLKDYTLDLFSNYEAVHALFSSLVPENWIFVGSCSLLYSLISLVSAVMVIGYIRNYKKMFVKE